MTNKWRNFSFRSTSGGDVSWAGGGINVSTDVDPNDASNTTTVTTGTPGAYPILSSDGSHNYGVSNATLSASTNATKTNAGSNTLLGGANAMSSARQAIQFDADAGTYLARIALGGSGSAARQSMFLFDGTFSRMSTDIGLTLNISLWTATTVFAANAIIASKTDLSIWKLTAGGGGSSGSTEPSGAGPTFTDGALTWTKTSRSMLAIIDATQTATTNVVDISSSVIACSSWGAVTSTITVSGTYGNSVTLFKVNGLSTSLRQFGLQLQQATLVDVTLTNEFSQATAAPTLYAGMPSGYQALKIVASSGAAAQANFALSGDLASYFTLTTLNTSEVWALYSGTPIPDSLAGTRTLIVTQTDAASLSSPHATTFSCTVTSSQGKPTGGSGVYAKISTPTWLSRKVVKDVTGAIWAGYAGQAFVSDQAVTSGADLSTKLAALTPDGTSWYRLRLQNGTYTGTDVTAYALNFGTGGLLIQPDTGHDPELNKSYQSLKIHGVEFNGLKIPCDHSLNGTAFYQFTFVDPGSGGIGGAAGIFNRFRFTNCRLGFLYGAGNTVADWSAKQSTLVLCWHGESGEISNCLLNGMHNGSVMVATRAQKFTNNDYRRMYGDNHDFEFYDLPTTTTWGVFADNFTYLEFSDSVVHADPDEMCLAAPAWATGVTVRKNEYKQNGGNIYRATVAGTTAGGGGGPTGTGTAITDNTVTWTFVVAATYASARLWTAGMTAAVNDYVITTMAAAGGTQVYQFVYQCTAITTGIAGGSNPWTAAALPTAGAEPSGAGQTTITDGGITWTYVKPAVYVNSAHQDTIQEFPFNGSSKNWAISTGFVLNQCCINTNNSPLRIYKATVAGTSSGSGTGPSGTGVGIVDGGITWAYVADALTTTANVLMENITEVSAGPIAGMGGRQYYFDNGPGNTGRGNRDNVTLINCLQSSLSIYGAQISDGELNAECNTFAGPAATHPENTVLNAQIAGSTGAVNTRVRARHNAVRAASNNPGTGGVYIEDEAVVDWSAVGTNTTGPRGYMVGPFDQDTASRWMFSALSDADTTAAADYRAQVRAILLPKSGVTAGISADAGSGSSRLSLRLGLGL